MRQTAQTNAEGKPRMLAPTIILCCLAAVVFIAAYRTAGSPAVAGLKSSVGQTAAIIPMLLAAFIIAEMMMVLIPGPVISQWIGREAGLRGIAAGTGAGLFTFGGPFVSYTMAAGFLRAGASAGTLVAFITSWALLSFGRLPIEVSILGWRFTLLRVAATFLLAPLAGLLAQMMVTIWRR